MKFSNPVMFKRLVSPFRYESKITYLHQRIWGLDLVLLFFLMTLELVHDSWIHHIAFLDAL